MSVGDINHYVLKPWTSPDEYFHRTIAEFVQEWSLSDPLRAAEVVVIADQWSPRGHELRSMLGRSGVPSSFYARGTQQAGRALVDANLLETAPDDVIVLLPALGRQMLPRIVVLSSPRRVPLPAPPASLHVLADRRGAPVARRRARPAWRQHQSVRPRRRRLQRPSRRLLP